MRKTARYPREMPGRTWSGLFDNSGKEGQVSESIKVRARCPSCKEPLTLSMSNSVLMVFDKAVFMSYWAIVCDRSKGGYPRKACGHRFFLFVDIDPDEAREAVRHFRKEGWPLTVQARPSAKVIDDYEEASEFRLEVPETLSSHLEQEVTDFGNFLRSLPDAVDLVELVFSAPPPKSLKPHRWR